MLLPLLLGGALLAGAAVAAWNLIQQSRSGGGQSSGSSTPSKEPGEQEPENPIIHDPNRDRDELLRRIVDSVEFALKQVVVDQRVIGTERQISPTPADDIEIRPIRSISEIGSVPSSVHAMDDDVFFGALAANSLPVIDHIRVVNLTEDIMGDPSKALVVLQDISGSMNDDGRISWAIRLNEMLLDRCAEQKAEYILFPYTTHVSGPYIATEYGDYENLKRRLPVFLGSDGGTETNSALSEVLKFVEQKKFDEVRILLVTDGQDSLDVNFIRNGLSRANAYLHAVCIASEENPALKVAADRYDYLSFNEEERS